MNISKTAIFVLTIALSGLFLFAGSALQTDAPGVRLRAAIEKEEVEGDLQAAIEQYKNIIADNGENRAVAASALLRLGGCYEKLGKDEAQKTYERLVRDYADQTEQAGAAQARLAALQEDSSSRNEPVFTTRQVWTGQDMDWTGAPSPDGRYLSFVDWKTGDLAIHDLESGINQRITNKGSWEDSEEFAQFSRWSPDSKLIAYDWYDGKYSMDLYVISPDEKKPRLLLDNENEWLQVFDWSPDGKRILIFFEKNNGTRQIILVSAEDGAITVLKTFEGRGDWPQVMRFSSDGRYIAYDFPQEVGLQERDIFLISTDGSQEFPLIRHPAYDCLLGWLPGDQGILFASDRTGSLEMYFVPVSNGKAQGQPEVVKSGVSQIIPMGFSKNGSFYYGQNLEKLDVYVATMDPESGRILDPPEKVIKRFEGTNSWPDYSFDGKYLAYVTSRNRSSLSPRKPNILCIRSIETGREREFITEFERLAGTNWAPDGRFIYLWAQDNQGEGIYRVDVQNGTFTLVVRAKFRIIHGDISPDGNILIYERRDDPREPWQIISRDLSTDEEKQLYSGKVKMFSISPDGLRLALMNADMKKVLQIMPISGGEPKELLRFEDPKDLRGSVVWNADGEYILFLRVHSFEEKWQIGLWRVAADGDEPEDLNLVMSSYQTLSVHPDGKHLVFDSFGSVMAPPSIWVMENFLPESKQEEGRVQ